MANKFLIQLQSPFDNTEDIFKEVFEQNLSSCISKVGIHVQNLPKPEDMAKLIDENSPIFKIDDNEFFIGVTGILELDGINITNKNKCYFLNSSNIDILVDIILQKDD